MRKIKSREEIESGQKRLKFIIGMVFIILLVFSTAGFALYGRSDTTDTDLGGANQDVYYNGQYWVYSSGGQEFYFINSPEDVQDIPVEVNGGIEYLVDKPLFIDSGDLLAVNELSINLGRYAARIQEACYGKCDEDLPEKNCAENLIVVREANDNRVYQEENCVFIEGDVRGVDAFLYRILRVNL